MYSQEKILQSTKTYWDSIEDAAERIKNADRIVIGAGSGLSASGGISYTDEALFKKWFPQYYASGMRSIVDMQSLFWDVNEKNADAFWGYWANHIQHIRYDSPALQPYLNLFELVKGMDYFICSTNVDGQFEKAGFLKERIFAPQGDYALFQCEKPCKQEVFDNKAMVANMVGNMDYDTMRIREEDVPRCPHCGRLLKPNLRKDSSFVENLHMVNLPIYESFIQQAKGSRLVLLELGVGYNTPGIIRYPFENFAQRNRNASLIRINLGSAAVPKEIEGSAVSIDADIEKSLSDILKICKNSEN